MTLLNYFDKIYIINLERSPERKQNMLAQMKKYNITHFVFLPGIDGKNLDINKLRENNEWAYPGNKFCDVTCSCGGNGHQLSGQQIALARKCLFRSFVLIEI